MAINSVQHRYLFNNSLSYLLIVLLGWAHIKVQIKERTTLNLEIIGHVWLSIALCHDRFIEIQNCLRIADSPDVILSRCSMSYFVLSISLLSIHLQT